MRLFAELRSRIQYKIILPFLLLTLLVALAGAAVAFLFITGSAQERLNNQLAQVARAAGDSIVRQESANLTFLREVAFAGPNPESGAPAVARALADADTDGLARALDPYVRISAARGVQLQRLIAFDRSRRALLDIQSDGAGAYTQLPAGRDLGDLWFAQQILQGGQDPLGDKYAGLLDLSDGAGRYLFTAVPVVENGQVVGGLILGISLDPLLQDIAARSQAALVTMHEANGGRAFASTAAPVEDLRALDMRPALLPAFADPQAARERGIFDVVRVNQRDYQVAYAPLQVRGAIVGLLAVGLASDYVAGPWAQAHAPLTILTVVLMLAIIGLGIWVARLITHPLQELVATARAVTSGDLERRSRVTTSDEVGVLSDSFNAMTAHLLDLYRTVRAEASQRAAIVESITDGVVVCDGQGRVLIINRATRELLGLGAEEPGPQHFAEIPLRPLGKGAPNFGQTRLADLFHLRESIVRMAVAPVPTEDGGTLGNVYVLQDMTSQVTIDRAKTNFIATISHELRTPLTVLGGNADLLLRGMMGPLNDEQRGLIQAMHGHAQTMAALINNVITIAGLDAGTLVAEPAPTSFAEVLQSTLWAVRRAAKTKGIVLTVDVPETLPPVLADAHFLRITLQQLLDNACRYTAAGGVEVRAAVEGQALQVDISDTGPGIAPELREQLFTRFTRGAEGINSAERGMGLGLAIARELTERQGGAIWLAYTSEAGSTFRLTLPIAHAAETSDTQAITQAA
ncbi:MAG TPA: ATP-binding protein [Roseiflexaceae bacterium]|nr:ATP-binding protein [Roseiflexaceae bacterium]